MYGKTIKLKVEATDGYTKSEDFLELKPNKIPIMIILYYLVILMSAILTLMGLIKYRGMIHGIFCRRLYKSGNYFITDDEPFIF